MAEDTATDASGSDQPRVFDREDLSGSRFQRVRLNDSRFESVDLRGARFHDVDLRGIVIRAALLVDAEINAEIADVRVNGVDIAPLVEAELDRRDPERAQMRPTDPDGFRTAWDILERRWAETVDRARALPPERLHERVNNEWSFTETLRHLVFATDAWVNRAILGDPSPWDPLDLPFDEMDEAPGVPWDREVRPSIDQVLALRSDRWGTVRRLLAELTDEQLAGSTTPVEGTGWPEPRSYPVAECLLIILSEEWEHRQYAERDLAVLDQTGPTTGGDA